MHCGICGSDSHNCRFHKMKNVAHVSDSRIMLGFDYDFILIMILLMFGFGFCRLLKLLNEDFLKVNLLKVDFLKVDSLKPKD